MTNRIAHVVGARPNFPKAAPVIKALSEHGIRQTLIHTGQHYDSRMSDAFFQQLGLPEPDINLGVGSGTHANQTAAVMVGLEPILLKDRPEVVVVYGDINSTLAAAIVCSKVGIPVAHVEAGLRSGDMSMPEEVNRVLTDRISDLLFATSPDAIANLASEGVRPSQIHFVGNPMIDSLLANLGIFDVQRIQDELKLPVTYAVATLHRPVNVDNVAGVTASVKAIHAVADLIPVVLPLHPRGRKNLEESGLSIHPNVKVLDPLGYVDFISLIRGSVVVLTDSGGVQEETTVLGIPCLTLRPNTERPITITHGTNRLTDFGSAAGLVQEVIESPTLKALSAPPLWDGKAGQRIARVLALSVGV